MVPLPSMGTKSQKDLIDRSECIFCLSRSAFSLGWQQEWPRSARFGGDAGSRAGSLPPTSGPGLGVYLRQCWQRNAVSHPCSSQQWGNEGRFWRGWGKVGGSPAPDHSAVKCLEQVRIISTQCCLGNCVSSALIFRSIFDIKSWIVKAPIKPENLIFRCFQ